MELIFQTILPSKSVRTALVIKISQKFLLLQITGELVFLVESHSLCFISVSQFYPLTKHKRNNKCVSKDQCPHIKLILFSFPLLGLKSLSFLPWFKVVTLCFLNFLYRASKMNSFDIIVWLFVSIILITQIACYNYTITYMWFRLMMFVLLYRVLRYKIP